MSESNTPRTDAVLKVSLITLQDASTMNGYKSAVKTLVQGLAEESKSIERELNETKQKLSKAVELINELRGYCKDAWDWKYGKRWDAEMEEKN